MQDIFADPVSAAIPWRDIEALFIALGAIVKEGVQSTAVPKAGGKVRVESAMGGLFGQELRVDDGG